MTTRYEPKQLAEWAYFAGLAGGILILLGAVLFGLIMLAVFGVAGFGFAASGMPFGGVEGLFIGFVFLLFAGTILVGLAAGALIVYGSVRVRRAPEEGQRWGVVIGIAGFVSFLGSGGFGIGAVAAIVSGVLAYTAGQRAREPAAAAP